jgi:hypothetical protein
VKQPTPSRFLDSLFAPVIAFFAANALARLTFSDHSHLTIAPDIRYMVQIRQIYATADVVLAFSIFMLLGYLGTYLAMRGADRRGTSRWRILFRASAILTFVLILPDLFTPPVAS